MPNVVPTTVRGRKSGGPAHHAVQALADEIRKRISITIARFRLCRKTNRMPRWKTGRTERGRLSTRRMTIQLDDAASKRGRHVWLVSQGPRDLGANFARFVTSFRGSPPKLLMKGSTTIETGAVGTAFPETSLAAALVLKVRHTLPNSSRRRSRVTESSSCSFGPYALGIERYTLSMDATDLRVVHHAPEQIGSLTR
jgi:hypothetical protein